ncbi:hypothetical protein [Pseudomonas sp. RGM2987]|uniref:hypothetical protein n=1 Tax=Pseudomonas sp. RGM2987 TaxID=2930090 RepID=UPI001FD65593|nr:hypothetical protein [Pseudomonas sp. RGM2987]MCJ8207301.1 hypothetical protein [Pseudomonas sp. RGM2987]
MIKTIPMWKMMIAIHGKKAGLAVLASLPVFIVTGAWMFLDGLQSGQKRQAAIGLICVVFFGACTLLFAPSKKYIPGKTFQGYRNKKLSSKTAVNYAYGLIVFIVAVFLILAPEHALSVLASGSVAAYSCYALSKSLKFHADIDFATNEYLATALGFPVGEKILVSYQNFASDEVAVGSNAFAVTATKLIIASYDGHLWKKLSRDLNQISRIGIGGSENQNYFVKLQFNDGADVLLCVGLYEKLTSSPILVIRRLLEAIDASLLGGSGVSQATPRRRVVVNSGTPAPTPQVAAPKAALASMAPTRNIEVAPDVLVAIQNAEEVVPGRKLEL